MPACYFSQKKVGVVARAVDVAHHGGTADVAGVIDDDVAEAEQALRNTGGNGHVLHLAQRNVSRGSGHQAGIDLQLGVGDRVTRSEEHTSELQSLAYLVCRLLLE